MPLRRALSLLVVSLLLLPAGAKADEPATPSPPAKWPTVVGARFDGGYAFRKLFDIPITGADIGGAIGAQPLEHGAFWGVVRVLVGSTEAGLKFYDVHFGAEGEAVFDRIRVGGGVGGFVLGVSRVTFDQTINTWGPEVRAHLRVDAIQADGFAIFVRAALSGAFEFYDSAAIWGPTVGAGVDFDLKGKRPE